MSRLDKECVVRFCGFAKECRHTAEFNAVNKVRIGNAEQVHGHVAGHKLGARELGRVHELGQQARRNQRRPRQQRVSRVTQLL